MSPNSCRSEVKYVFFTEEKIIFLPLPGDNGKMYSPPLKFFGTMCLQFDYHMSGATTGSMNVTVSGNLVFFARGDKGDMWRKASVNVSAIEGLHRVSHALFLCLF